MQEVPHPLVHGDPMDRSARERAAVDVPVHRRQVDVVAVGVEHVVVVHLGEAGELDRLEPLVRRLEPEPPQDTMTVHEKGSAVVGPVRRLDQDLVGLEQHLRGRNRRPSNENLRSLSGLERAVGHGHSSDSSRRRRTPR